MKNQKIVSSTDWYKFTQEIRTLSADGWFVVPESTRIELAKGETFMFERYFAVMEK